MTVTLSLGISKPAELIAHRTRERASSMEGSLVPMTSMPALWQSCASVTASDWLFHMPSASTIA